MIRTIFTETALFLSPFVAYALFLWATRSGLIHPFSWSPRELGWVTVVALLAVIGGFVAIAEFSGGRPGAAYVPAHVESGRLVPGTVK